MFSEELTGLLFSHFLGQGIEEVPLWAPRLSTDDQASHPIQSYSDLRVPSSLANCLMVVVAVPQKEPHSFCPSFPLPLNFAPS